jgi:pyruvate kinase
MSRHKIDIPIFALTQDVKTQRALSMYRNVIPLRLEISSNRDVALHQVEHLLSSIGVVKSGDMVTLTIGEPMGQPGGTNTLKIIKVK